MEGATSSSRPIVPLVAVMSKAFETVPSIVMDPLDVFTRVFSIVAFISLIEPLVAPKEAFCPSKVLNFIEPLVVSAFKF